jgi:hypothetical protein
VWLPYEVALKRAPAGAGATAVLTRTPIRSLHRTPLFPILKAHPLDLEKGIPRFNVVSQPVHSSDRMQLLGTDIRAFWIYELIANVNRYHLT